MRRPSGDQTGSQLFSIVEMRVAGPPLEDMTKMAAFSSSRVEQKAILVPSGDQVASPS